MNNEKFVEVIKQVVRDGAIEDVSENLENPPGRRPSVRLKRMSEFFKKLDSDEQEILGEIIKESVDASLFGFFAVLDGVRKCDDESESSLKLEYINKGKTTILNNPNEEYLHDIYNRQE